MSRYQKYVKRLMKTKKIFQGAYRFRGLIISLASVGLVLTGSYMATKGDPIANLQEDLAAEQKARAVYENLIDLTNDPDVIGPLLWLRQREIVHYTRFKELFEYYEKQLNNNTNNLNTNNNNVNNQIMNGMPNNQLNSQYMNQYGQMM